MRSLFGRTRWAAVGAAVAAMFIGGIGIAEAARSSGDKPVLITINPCRLVDTRPATQVGPRRTPIPAKQAYTVTARGRQGRCNIPSDAIGLSTNVTAVNATSQTNVRLYPADQSLPDVSNLNPSPNSPPAWNAVTTDLSSTGKFKIYNWSGSVDVIVDINGYYVDHTHDDRYFTKSQVESGFGTINTELSKKASLSQVYTRIQSNNRYPTKQEAATALDQKANLGDVYTRTEADNTFATMTDVETEVRDIAAERTDVFDAQLDYRTVAAGRFDGGGILGSHSGTVNVTKNGTGNYTLQVTSPLACATGSMPVVTANVVTSTPPFVLNVNADATGCVNDTFSFGIVTYDLVAGTLGDPDGVLFTVTGTNYPEPPPPPAP